MYDYNHFYQSSLKLKLKFYILIFKQKQEEWRIVFIITAVIYLIGAIILLIFTKGTVEPWAVKSKASQKDHEESLPLKTIE